MISKKVKDIVESPSNGVIRKMFEEGAILKQKYGADKVYDYPAYNVRGRITADNGMFIGGEATKKNDSPRKTKFYFGFDFLKFFGFK